MSNNIIPDLLKDIEGLKLEIAAKEEKITSLKTKLSSAKLKMNLEKRKGTYNEFSDIHNVILKLENDLNKEEVILDINIKGLEEKRIELSRINDPDKIIKQCSNKVPFLMLPVRLETKYMYLNTDHPELWVRIYPDDIAIDTHEESFTDDEIEKAKFYFNEVTKAEAAEDQIKSDLDEIVGYAKRDVILKTGEELFLSTEELFDVLPDDFEQVHIEGGVAYWQEYKRIRETIKIPAWMDIVNSFGPYRSAYIVNKGGDFFKAVDIPLKPDSWSRAPRSYVMPDYFVLRLYKKSIINNKTVHEPWKDVGRNIKEFRGRLIKYPLAVGPEPLSEGDDPNQLFFDKDSEWMIDFNKAVETGMGIKVDLKDLDSSEINAGFSRIIAIGIKTPEEVKGHTNLLCQMFDNHHYSGGFSFLKQGTPTNNTGETESEYNSQEENYGQSYKIEVASENFAEEETDNNVIKDGFRFANVLGLKDNIDIFKHIPGADETDNEDAKQMAVALWPATWGTYLFDELYGKLAHQIDIEEFRNHFVEYVRARNSYPTIRIEDMPYGILPGSAFSLWEEKSANESKRKFYQGFQSLLYKLSQYWLKLSEDTEKIPRVGSSNDPEKELVQILGMQALSDSFRMRPVINEKYLTDLLDYCGQSLLQTENILTRIINSLPLANNPVIDSTSNNTLSSSYQMLNDKYLEAKTESAKLFKEMTDCEQYPFILDTTTWGEGYDLELPLVQETPVSETNNLTPNYIQAFYDAENLREFLEIRYEGEKTPILFMLLRIAVKSSGSNWENNDDPVKKSFGYLKNLPSAKLKRITAEVLDLSAHRLDAYITSFFTRRLEELRNNQNNKSIYIGAYGWLEDLKPRGDNVSGGYIHAPSATHGISAAILRNAYLTHADSENPDRMSINLSSGRVKKALWFLEGIRQGQSLNILLGYSFERSLHEDHKNGNTSLFLDQYILPFRKLYPLNISSDTEITTEQDVQAMAPRNVVDGLALLKAYRRDDDVLPIPFETDRVLPNPGTPNYSALMQELNDMDETFDAINDLLLSESVHRAVLADYLGSGAVLDCTSADGTPPDEFLVSKTPRGGVNIKHHCLIIFPGDETVFSGEDECFLHKWSTTKRSTVSPALNAWAAKILGDPEKIICYAEYVKDYQIVKARLNLLGIVDTRDNSISTKFGISPLDFVYLSASPLKSESTEFEEIMTYYIKKDRDLDKDCEIHLSYKRDDNFNDDERSFAQVIPLARAFLKLITNTSYIKPQDLYLPEEAEIGEVSDSDETEDREFEFTGYTNSDYERIKNKIKSADNSGIYNELESLKSKLIQKVKNNLIEEITELLEKAIPYGIPGSIPKSCEVGDAEGSGGIEISDFSLEFSQNEGDVTEVVIGRLTDIYGSDLKGGESIARLYLEISGRVTGIEKIEISPKNSNSIFDKNGNAIPDTVSTGEISLYDPNSLSIIGSCLGPKNSYIDVTFSCPVYGMQAGNGSVEISDFSLNFSPNEGDAAEVVISRVSNINGSDLKGGESKIRIYLNISGTVSGVETIKISPEDSTSIFDEDGNGFPETVSTGDILLTDEESLRIIGYNISHDNSYVDITFGTPVYNSELYEKANAIINEIDRRLENCDSIFNKAESVIAGISVEDSADIKNDKIASAIDLLIQCFKAILGKSFVYVPQFKASNSEELSLTFSRSENLLDGEDKRSPLIWFQQAAYTHTNLRKLESLMMIAEIQNNQALNLSIGQLPYKEEDRWIALPWKSGIDRETKEKMQGTLSIINHSPFNVDYSDQVSGLVLDKWDEIIPSEEETTSLVYQFNRPSCESPNVCLLCVSPVLETQDSIWEWDHLVKCVEETMDMAKIRAVDSDAFKKLGKFLPAIYMRAQVSQNAITFPFTI